VSDRVFDAAVLIATYNRAQLLGETLDCLAVSDVPPGLRWEVVVIDNHSNDHTPEVVRSRQPNYPVPLRYVFERKQGRSCALNTGFTVTGARILLYTDDDVCVGRRWVRAACEPLAAGWDYVGGPVQPIWGAPCPAWLDDSLWGTIAILDYGTESFSFEERRRVPLGANMGVRRQLIESTGGFREELGRSSGRTILGQEVPDLLVRARAEGARGCYVPEMTVGHHVPAARLTHEYFRRWWYGKGVSKSMLEAFEPITELGIDLRDEPHIGPVPRFMIGSAVRDAFGYLQAATTGSHTERVRREMMLAYFVGYWSARWPRLSRPKYPVAPVGVMPVVGRVI
jgi:glucosyl-dolichyl phosphate glucuronosyltransferase